MCEIDYAKIKKQIMEKIEAAKLMGKIVFKAWKLTQDSSVGVGFEYFPWSNSFCIKIYPREKNCFGDYDFDIDGSYYINGNGKEIRGLYTPVEITTENCMAILEKLKEYEGD